MDLIDLPPFRGGQYLLDFAARMAYTHPSVEVSTF